MKKKVIISLVVLLCLGLIGLNSALAAGPTDEGESQRIFNQEFRINANPLEITIIKYPEYITPFGQEVQLIYRVKNHSALIEEVTYILESNHGLGGIEAVIDYDGPFGPKDPEPYDWQKVPVQPGDEQYLYVSFPVPSVYEKEVQFNLIIDRWLGPRG